MYVVPASGAHAGPSQRPDGTPISDNLEQAAGSLTVTFETPPMVFTYALGYSYSNDPNFMHCAEQLGTQTPSNFNALWLGGCGLSGGSSGGPWIQGDATSHKVMSVNSWGFTGAPGMGAPRFDGANGGHAADVFALAKCATFEDASNDEGVLWSPNSGCTTQTPAPTPALTESPTSSPPNSTPTPTPSGSCNDAENWHDSEGSQYTCDWYAEREHCEHYGSSFANDGKTAQQACCVCQTQLPTDAPTVAPTACTDLTLSGAVWHDSEGSNFDCTWYSQRDHCGYYGNEWANGGMTAAQACCACNGGTDALVAPLGPQ